VPSLIVPSLDLEQSFWRDGFLRLVGIDEAGIGPIAGPVVAAAVRLPPWAGIIPGVRDSKTLSAARREELLAQIVGAAAAVGVGAASVDEIARLNVRRASHLAMARALARIGRFDHLLIDGRPIRDHDLGPRTTIVDGDAISFSISCASIVAKVCRDRLMTKLARRFPLYGWEHNFGYPTVLHLAALRSRGVTPYHRSEFGPVRALRQRAPVETPCD
jgi:ribonuclease HII